MEIAGVIGFDRTHDVGWRAIVAEEEAARVVGEAEAVEGFEELPMS